MHERDSKRKIYVMLFQLLGVSPPAHTEAPRLSPSGGRPPDPSTLPPNLWLLVTPLININDLITANTTGKPVFVTWTLSTEQFLYYYE